MLFQPTPSQIRILRALQRLEFEPSDCATIDGTKTGVTIRFSTGVPRAVLEAYVGLALDSFDLAVEPLVRRELTTPLSMKVWPFPGKELCVVLRDGRVMFMLWQRATLSEHMERLRQLGVQPQADSEADRPTLHLVEPSPAEPGFRIEVWVGVPEGTQLRRARCVPKWSATTVIEAYSLSRPGLECLDSLPPDVPASANLEFGFISQGRVHRTAEELQRSLLEALRRFEFEGIQLRQSAANNSSFRMRFSAGVPTTLVREWLEVPDDDLRNVVRYCERLGFVSLAAGDLIESLTPSSLGAAKRQDTRVFDRPDGKVVRIVWEPTPDGFLLVVAQSAIIDEKGELVGDSFLPHVRNSTEQLLRVTGDGLKWLKERSGQDLGQLVAAPEAAATNPIRELDRHLAMATTELIRLANEAVLAGRVDAAAVHLICKDVEARCQKAHAAIESPDAKESVRRAHEAFRGVANAVAADAQKGRPAEPGAVWTPDRSKWDGALNTLLASRSALRIWFDEPAGSLSVPQEADQSGGTVNPAALHSAGTVYSVTEIEVTHWLEQQHDARATKIRTIKLPAQLMISAMNSPTSAHPIPEHFDSVSRMITALEKAVPAAAGWFVARRNRKEKSLTYVPGRRHVGV
jgi:hypothetical protein